MNTITSVEEALHSFEDFTIKRGLALDADDFKSYNKQFSQVRKCIMYLHEKQQIHLLRIYFKHNNQHVRFSAASALLPLYEKESTEILSDIASGNYGLLSLNAKITLEMWRNGELSFSYQTNPNKNLVPQKEDDYGDSAKKPTSKQEDVPYSNSANNEKTGNEEFPPEILRLSRIFGCPPADDTELRNEELEFYVMLKRETQELTINVNTFINPYTQDVVAVYQERLNRLKAYEHVATISADRPSRLGFMKILMTIPMEKATDDVLTQIKNTIYSIYDEWKLNETTVCFKAEYNGATSYFEGEWWMPARAVIKKGNEYERYDFSDETKYDEEMWELVEGDYDEFEKSDSFELIDRDAFQIIWNDTERIHEPMSW